MRTVVAAVIFRDLKVLVCQRKRGDSHELKWEFPGGKVELGESPAQALARELREELGVDSTIGEELFRTTHRYQEREDEWMLIFFRAEIRGSAALRNLAFERFEWADPSALPRYDFLQADKELIDRLASRSIRLR